MSEFTLPKNVKQIGGIDGNLRIYVEDYVMSYLNQYTSVAGYDERLAVFVGKRSYMESLPVLMISGAILGKYAEEEDGRQVLGERSEKYIREQLDTHFRGMEVVGVMQSQPSYGTTLSPAYELDFLDNYREENSVMLVMDPLERLGTFYVRVDDDVVESNGYFIYYERNEPMNNYMQENKIVKTLRSSIDHLNDKVAMTSEFELEETNDVISFGRKEKVYLGSMKSRGNIDKEERRPIQFTQPEPEPEEVPDPLNLIPNHRVDIKKERKPRVTPTETMEATKPDNRKKTTPIDIPLIKEPTIITRANRPKGTIKAQRRVTNLLVTMCSVMLIISFVMAGALVRSGDRLSNLEQEFETLTGAYINIIQSLQATQEAFAMTNVVEPGTVIEENGTELAATGTQTPVFAPLGGNFPETYTVQAGDNLFAISQMFYGSIGRVEDIRHLNDLDDADVIVQGMILKLPQPE